MADVREVVERTVAGTISKLPAPVKRALGGRPIRIDGQQLHPEVQVALRFERWLGGDADLPVAEWRRRRRRDARVFSGPRIEVARVTDLEIPGPSGSGTIPARLYVPEGAGDRAPLIVFFHGGGHVIGDLDTHDQPCRFLARESGAKLLAVDYRLGPEHRFPAAVDDSYAAWQWAARETELLGADPGRIAVCGDSAGGNLAAVVAQLARDAGGPAPALQCLIYPVCDYTCESRSYDLFAEGFFLTRAEMQRFRENYFGSAAEHTDPRASPLLADDVSGLAPAFVLTCGFDPLRDEGEAYAERMREAGVPVTLRREPDLVHGYINAVGLGGRAAESLAGVARALRDGLAARGERAGVQITS